MMCCLLLTRSARGDNISSALTSICRRNTAKRYDEECPRAVHLFKNSDCMDNESSSCDSMEKINEIIQGAEALLSADNFEEKGWQVTYHYSSIQ